VYDTINDDSDTTMMTALFQHAVSLPMLNLGYPALPFDRQHSDQW